MSDRALEVLAETLGRLWTEPEEDSDLAEWQALPGRFVAALKAAGFAVVEVPTIAYKGPNDTDASMFLTAADKAESAKYPVGGGNVGAAVASVLRQVADTCGGVR